MNIKIIRSRRRRKTVGARMVDSTMVIRAPYFMSDAELTPVIHKLQAQFRRRAKIEELARKEDLASVFDRLNKKYFGGRLRVNKIEYSPIQNRRYGSVSLRTGTIRISHQLASAPGWVRDYIVIHEMAHLIEPNHGKTFWSLVNQYKLTERARGFLIAMEYRGDEVAETEEDRQALMLLTLR